MPEELEGLLNRIQEEGVKKAADEKSKIIADAQKEAVSIVENAKTEAELIIKNAKEDASKSESRANAAIKQSSRDIILSLRKDIEDRFSKIVKSSIGEAMTPELMGKILLVMVENYSKNDPNTNPDIEVLLVEKDMQVMQSLFQGALLQDLKNTPEISLGNDFTAGIKIGFKGEDIFFDFTDDAISDIICTFIGPKLAKILQS